MLRNDIRYALRLMRRSPGFTTVAVLSLALGIGANTAIFSLFNTIMLRQLPVSHPEQLVEFLERYAGQPRGDGYLAWEKYEYFRDSNHVFSALTGTSFNNAGSARVGDGESDRVVEETVLGNYFGVLGLKPAMGRLLGPDDVPASGVSNVAVVSWFYWDTHLHRDRDVLGKRIFLDDTPVTIVGVAPRAYTGPRVGARTDFWLPREKDQVSMIARLKPGVTLAQAQAEMSVLFQNIRERGVKKPGQPLTPGTLEVESAAAGFAQVRDLFGKSLLLLMGVVGLLLLLACINMASMLLARGASRRLEMAVRIGLGASRGRLVRQMLTESLLLSLAGTLAGLVLAYFATGVLVRIMASGRLHERIVLQVVPDLHLIFFAAGIAVLTGILFGLAPAWYAFRSAPESGLRQQGRAGETRSWRLFGKGLIAVQVALSILLLTAAGVFLTHLSRMRNFDLGFRSDHVLLVVLDPSHSGYKREQLVAPYQQLLARLETIPGVRSASLTGCTPIQGCGSGARFVTVPGYVERPEPLQCNCLGVAKVF
jgi:putative ABC transport system permease protein